MKDQRTDAELNRIIAEWYGWKFIPSRDIYISGQVQAMPEEWESPNGDYHDDIPGYCVDLNAVHEAIRTCNDSKSKRWVFWLDQILRQKLRDEGVHQWPDDFDRYNAQARQRAEALVRVIEEGGK